MDFELYRFGDDASDLLRSSDKVRVGKVGIARCGPVPPVAANFADQGQVLARRDGLTGPELQRQEFSEDKGDDGDRRYCERPSRQHGRPTARTLGFGEAGVGHELGLSPTLGHRGFRSVPRAGHFTIARIDERTNGNLAGPNGVLGGSMPVSRGSWTNGSPARGTVRNAGRPGPAPFRWALSPLPGARVARFPRGRRRAGPEPGRSCRSGTARWNARTPRGRHRPARRSRTPAPGRRT